MNAPDFEFWLANKTFLEHLVSETVGFRIHLDWGASGVTGVGEMVSWQIMLSPEAEYVRSVFDEWYCTKPQWFSNPLEAAVAFLNAWREWVTEGAAQSRWV